MEDCFTRSSFVKSEPIHDCSIIEGGIFIVLSIDGTQFHISVFTLRKTCPLSLAGAVIRTSEYSFSFDQVFIVIVLVQSGLTTVIVMVPWLDNPRLFSSALRIISSAVSP